MGLGRLRPWIVVPALLAALAVSCRTGPPAPGARRGSGDSAPAAPADPAVPAAPADHAGWVVHRDPALGYRLLKPPGFVVRARDVAQFAAFDPRPVAAVDFMNPTNAAGELAGVEPPDLALRVFAVREPGSLESWLFATGLARRDGATAPRPYRAGRTPGLEVCLDVPIAPGCSVFFRSGSSVYQLAPLSVEGEAMVRSFEVSS